MKNALFIFALLFIAQVVQAGGISGGGGILISADFVRTGRAAISILGLGDPSLNSLEILKKLETVKVIPSQDICNRDSSGHSYCEDAHYDENLRVIIFDAPKWKLTKCGERLLLASHEFLRAAGVESDEYSYSNRFILGTVAQCGVNPSESQQKRCADLIVKVRSRIAEFCEQNYL